MLPNDHPARPAWPVSRPCTAVHGRPVCQPLPIRAKSAGPHGPRNETSVRLSHCVHLHFDREGRGRLRWQALRPGDGPKSKPRRPAVSGTTCGSPCRWWADGECHLPSGPSRCSRHRSGIASRWYRVPQVGQDRRDRAQRDHRPGQTALRVLGEGQQPHPDSSIASLIMEAENRPSLSQDHAESADAGRDLGLRLVDTVLVP